MVRTYDSQSCNQSSILCSGTNKLKLFLMKFDILTIFPNQIETFVKEGIFRVAKEKGLVQINIHDLRKWTKDKHKTVDGTPFGGGAGMVMMVEPVFNAIKELREENTKVVITTPRGEKLSQPKLKEMSTLSPHYIIVCGHYEGLDERIHEYLGDIEISIGDYILSGGELPALVLMDGIIRLLPRVLGNELSLSEESFEEGLEYPQYTKPSNFNDWEVPSVLLSGNHEKIKRWRKEKSIEITKKRRPDIVKDI